MSSYKSGPVKKEGKADRWDKNIDDPHWYNLSLSLTLSSLFSFSLSLSSSLSHLTTWRLLAFADHGLISPTLFEPTQCTFFDDIFSQTQEVQLWQLCIAIKIAWWIFSTKCQMKITFFQGNFKFLRLCTLRTLVGEIDSRKER
jgi:hypothetical protein